MIAYEFVIKPILVRVCGERYLAMNYNNSLSLWNFDVIIVAAFTILGVAALGSPCVVDICGKGRHPAKFWHCFDQNVLSCAVKVASEDVDARCIAVWPRQGVDEAGPKQIVY